MASPPASTKTSLGQRLRERARQRWPQLAGIGVRFRGQFAYVTGKLPDGSELPLCRLRYLGYPTAWLTPPGTDTPTDLQAGALACGARRAMSLASQGKLRSSAYGVLARPARRTTPGPPARNAPGRHDAQHCVLAPECQQLSILRPVPAEHQDSEAE